MPPSVNGLAAAVLMSPNALPPRWSSNTKRAPLSSKTSATFEAPLANFRPTQMAVGMRAVAAKREKVERRADSNRRLRRYLEKRPIPAVLGPGNGFYIIDHHHLSLALWQSEVQAAFVTLVDDLSHLSKTRFLERMLVAGWLHAYDSKGQPACPTMLPETLDRLRPDGYRDLAWSVREAGGFEKTDQPFAEFRWANFFRACIPHSTVRRDFDLAHDKAMWIARSKAARRLPGFVGSRF